MEHIDGAQIALYAFWLFFFGLVYWLRKEDKREGYPLESERGTSQGFPVLPTPKPYIGADGKETQR
ncbi:MAG: hypothetical protein KA180_03460 [Gemmatimonadales bacterium]|nr:hypothetical protein [Gemmatimonadales bacterium]